MALTEPQKDAIQTLLQEYEKHVTELVAARDDVRRTVASDAEWDAVLAELGVDPAAMNAALMSRIRKAQDRAIEAAQDLVVLLA